MRRWVYPAIGGSLGIPAATAVALAVWIGRREPAGAPVVGALAAAVVVIACLGGWLVREAARRARVTAAELNQSRVSVASRTQLLATLAHEVRTPLTVMQATEGVLLDETPGPLTERQRKFLESIHASTQRLIHFSENMLAGIKVDRGWMPDRTASIDLRRITRQVIEMMQPMLDQRGQQVRYTFPSMLTKPLADEAWIRQVLVNLLHNASKHTGTNGLIMVSVTQDDHWIVVTVTDNGEGLVGSSRESIFTEFYQEQPHSGAGQDGAGLGLAIVRSVIERHGGRVYASTSPGVGTMVSFALPVGEGA